MTYEQAEQLSSQAWIAIGEEDWEEADKIGQQLIEAGYESGYRVRSATQESQENWDEAEAILREGVQRFPNIWQLHLQLGTLYYLQGRFEEGLAVYDRALTLPDVERNWIEMNRAAAMAQTGQIDEALNLLQGIDDDALRNSAMELKMQILDQMMRYDLVLELAEEELEHLITPETEEEAAVMSRILSYVAAAVFAQEEETTEPNEKETHTLFYLQQAIAYDRSNELAMMLSREIRGEFAEPGILYGIMVQANYVEDGVSTPVLSTYGVLADSVEEAVAMIKEYEIEEIDQDSMQVLEVEEGEPEDEEELKGLYFVGGLGFMDDDDLEDEEE